MSYVAVSSYLFGVVLGILVVGSFVGAVAGQEICVA